MAIVFLGIDFDKNVFVLRGLCCTTRPAYL